ncbi:hypothetical protein CRUP_005038 [Coryphaenoides rupestris]|nr:hypothetical protein CRUP_005038 [Coryphaenoides rupestris]
MAAGDLRIPGEGVLIGDKLYSGVKLTLDYCQVPAEQLRSSPSADHGLSPDTEEQLRMRGCELIQAAGILLKLPQVAMATGQILFQRFFYCKSFVRHCAEMVAMACVHLSSKIEEEPRRIRDVINVFHHLKKGRGGRTRPPLPLDAAYVNTKAQVIKTERRVLKELGFCVHVIVMYLQVLECEKNTPLVQMAWNYMNDSLRTDIFLRFSAETVACACIYLSSRALQIPLPDQPAWFLLFGAAEEDLREICRRILRLYSLPTVPLATLLLQVDKCRQAMDVLAAKAKAGETVLLCIGTPTLDSPAANFSPASKTAGSCTAEDEEAPPSPLTSSSVSLPFAPLAQSPAKTRSHRSGKEMRERSEGETERGSQKEGPKSGRRVHIT